MERKSPGRVVALCGAVNAVGGGLAWALVPVLMPVMAKELSLSHTAGGLVWGAAPLGIALTSPFGGLLADRFGARRTVFLGLLLGVLSTAARALAFDGVTLGLAMLVFGAHVGICAPAIPRALATHVPIQRLGRANGVAVLCYTLATALTVLVGAMLAPMVGGWRGSMLVAAGALLVTAAIWRLAMPEGEGDLPHASIASIGEVLRLARQPGLRRIGAMQFLLFGGYLALLGFLPRALVEAGMAPSLAGAAIAAWLIVAAAANLAGPWLSDRLGRRRPLVMGGAMLAGLSLLAMAFLPARLGAGFLLLGALGGGSFAPLLLSLPAELRAVGPRRAGAALGLVILMGQVGGFLLPVVTGFAAQHAGGLPAALALLGLAHLAILLPARGLAERAGGEAGVSRDTVAVA